MKIRQQVAKPCEKKGIDNSLISNSCECKEACDKLGGLLRFNSAGTADHRKKTTAIFDGCLVLEESLIADNLVRYESREVGGLEVLFEGIEGVQNLNAEIFNDDYLDGVDQNNPASAAHFFLDPLGNFLLDPVDNEKASSKGSFINEGLAHYFPEALGYAQTSAYVLSVSAPTNLQDSFFLAMYSRGEFDSESEDIQDLVTCMVHGIDTSVEMRKIWPRYTKARHEALKAVIWAKVFKKMPWWAKRFNRIWDKLSDAQAEALTLEWFYEGDEKPSQAENAKRLGISIASYQERLNWAYKKLESLYPEFGRVRRRGGQSQR